MHVISLKRLREFWAIHPNAERPLATWYNEAKTADWAHIAEVRTLFPNADQVGKFTVYNIGGNKFRLFVAIHFNRGKIFVRDVLTHAEYDRGDWKKDANPKRESAHDQTRKPKKRPKNER